MVLEEFQNTWYTIGKFSKAMSLIWALKYNNFQNSYSIYFQNSSKIKNIKCKNAYILTLDIIAQACLTPKKVSPT